MSETKKLEWDPVGEHIYETGTDRGVLYKVDAKGAYGKGVAWNGLGGVNQNPSGAESTPIYANNKKYLNLVSDEDFAFTITAYQSPEEFDECDGMAQLAAGVTVGQQPRSSFGMSYRTLLGNDTEGTSHGYIIHLVYGATASPSQKDYKSVNNDPEAMELSWDCSTVPVEVPNAKKPTAHITINSTKVKPEQLKQLEEMLYGTETADPKLPLPSELLTIFANTEQI